MAELICFVAGSVVGWFVQQYRTKLLNIKSAVEEELAKK